MILFNSGNGHQKKLYEVACENVNLYRIDRGKKLENARVYLIGENSPIKKEILDASIKGEVSVTINFNQLNKNNKLNNTNFYFDDVEVNKLVICVIDYLEQEGFNYLAFTLNNSIQLKINWCESGNNPLI